MAVVMILMILCCHLIEKEEETIEEVWEKDGFSVTVQGTVIDKKITENGVTLLLRECYTISEDQRTALQQQILVYLKNEEQTLILEIGRNILVEGIIKTFHEPTNPGNFNQKSYYRKQKISCMLQKASLTKIAGNIDFLREGMWSFRWELSEKIVSNMGTRYGGILCTMLFCEDGYEEDETKEVYQKSGLGHLLAVSSLHMMFWGMGLYKMLKKLHIHKYVAVMISTVGLGVYMFFIGGSVSAVRAFLMFVIQMGAVLCGREYDGLTALSITAILQLLVQPLYLFDAAFLLSYGAVLGIYLVGERMKGQVIEVLRVPMAVQMTILPVMLFFYNEICIYSFVWNLIAVPMASMVMSLGAMGIIFTPLLELAKGILWFWEMGSRWVLSLPFSRWVTGQPQLWQIILYYCILVVFLFLKNRKNIKLPVMLGMIGLGSCVMIFPQKLDRTLEVTMVDVGQGDCIFVKSPTGETFLIDGGSSSVSQVGKYKIEPFLKYKGIGRLDYVFLSHGDGDHVSGIVEMLGRQELGVKIGAVVLPPKSVWDENLQEIVALAQSEEIPVYSMSQGEMLNIGAVRLDCLWPPRKWSESGNESSMVLSMSCGEIALLFTGDLELAAEEQVSLYLETMQKKGALPESYEILKVGHHGSKNATGEQLLNRCTPKIALISAGEDNSYGHPNPETVERLEEIGCKVFCTITGGAIQVSEEKDSLRVKVYK